jgi:hypothetical protein
VRAQRCSGGAASTWDALGLAAKGPEGSVRSPARSEGAQAVAMASSTLAEMVAKAAREAQPNQPLGVKKG